MPRKTEIQELPLIMKTFKTVKNPEMIKTKFEKIIEISDKKLKDLITVELDVEFYDREKDAREDWGIGRTASTVEGRLSLIHSIWYFHLISKNAMGSGKEERIYSYNISHNKLCKVSQIQKNISKKVYSVLLSLTDSKIDFNDCLFD